MPGLRILPFKKRSFDFKVTDDGQLLHWASGEPVRAGDLIAGEAYTFDRPTAKPLTSEDQNIVRDGRFKAAEAPTLADS